MTSMFGKGGPKEIRWEATVIGPCKHCGAGAEFWPDRVCFGGEHEATFTRPLGTISRWHRSRVVRCWWRVGDVLGTTSIGGKNGSG